MSTQYRLQNRSKALGKKELIARLALQFGIKVSETRAAVKDETKDECCEMVSFTDGKNYIHSYPDGEGKISDFERFGGNDPVFILNAISELTGSNIISEHDDEFYHEGLMYEKAKTFSYSTLEHLFPGTDPEDPEMQDYRNQLISDFMDFGSEVLDETDKRIREANEHGNLSSYELAKLAATEDLSEETKEQPQDTKPEEIW